MMNSIKTSSLDAVMADMSHVSAAVPEKDVFNLPFLYRGVEQVLQLANGPVGTQLLPKIYQAFGCEVLGFSSDGSRNLSNNKRPVRTPADMVGLEMAVGTSKIQRDTMLAFGAIPTVVELTAVYTRLQTDLVEGTDKTLADMIELKLYCSLEGEKTAIAFLKEKGFQVSAMENPNLLRQAGNRLQGGHGPDRV
jgi:TRAP-type transport system periplasmic protein